MRILSNCPICYSIESKIISFNRHHIDQNKYNFKPFTKDNDLFKKVNIVKYFFERNQCLNCDHIYERLVFDKSEEIEYHTAMYASNQNETINLFQDRFLNLEIMLKELKIIKDLIELESLLDVGSAFGEFCFLVKSLNLDVSGFDLCEKSNHYLRKHNINCYNSFKSIDRKFRIIRVSHVLSHIHNNLEEFVKKLFTYLQLGGIIWFIDHNAKFFNINDSPLWHVNVFSETSSNLFFSRFFNLLEIKPSNLNIDPYIFKVFRKIRTT